MEGGLHQNQSEQTRTLLESMRRLVEKHHSDWHTLPPAAYNSDDIFELERIKIFRPGWICVGRADQVSRPGDFLSVDVVGEPLVMVRDATGQLRVLSRVCRHRWMEVCSGGGNSKFFRCPYHGWTYDLQGALVRAPEMDHTPGFDPKRIQLPEVRHEVWQGFVYVNLNGCAKPLETRLSAVDEVIAEYELPTWKTVRTIDWGDSPWDWKVMQDNGDCYHHIALHATTVEPVYPARSSGNLASNGWYTVVYAQAQRLQDDIDGQPIQPILFPSKRGLTDFQRTHFIIIYVLPNYMIFLQPDMGVLARVFPIRAGLIRLFMDIFVPPEALAHPRFEELLKAAEELVRTVHLEDIVACASVQRGLQSALSEPGPLSHLEGHNRSFAHWVARRLTE